MWHLLPTHCFVGNALKIAFIDSRLALLCFLRLSTSVLSCLPFAFRLTFVHIVLLNLETVKPLLFGTFQLISF